LKILVLTEYSVQIPQNSWQSQL